MITRRRILAGLGAAALSGPRLGFGQQQKAYRIGYLANNANPRTAPRSAFPDFVGALQKLGLAEGRNLEIRILSQSKTEPFSQLAAKLVADKVDLIVTTGSASTKAAIEATKAVPIPIVFGSAVYPVEQGFIKSYARPGGHVTGLALEEAGKKRIELLKEVLPKGSQFARLYDPRSLPTAEETIRQEYAAAARALRVSVEHIEVGSLDKVREQFAAAKAKGLHAFILTAGPVFVGDRSAIAQFTTEFGIPTMCSDGRFAEEGALVSYSEHFPELYRRAAGLVHKILVEKKAAADLPVELPMEFDLVVNLGTARKLGLHPLPAAFMARNPRTVSS